jgi:hypothetical protein
MWCISYQTISGIKTYSLVFIPDAARSSSLPHLWGMLVITVISSICNRKDTWPVHFTNLLSFVKWILDGNKNLGCYDFLFYFVLIINDLSRLPRFLSVNTFHIVHICTILAAGCESEESYIFHLIFHQQFSEFKIESNLPSNKTVWILTSSRISCIMNSIKWLISTEVTWFTVFSNTNSPYISIVYSILI